MSTGTFLSIFLVHAKLLEFKGLIFEVDFYVGHLTFIGRVTVIVSIVVDIVVPGVTPPGRGQLKKNDKYSSFGGIFHKKLYTI